jgi:tripartite-type tricarboxylate transporter receptor subunit TctC
MSTFTLDIKRGVTRRQALALGLAASAAPGVAFGEAYPSKPIRLVIGYNGGLIDAVARMVAAPMGELLGTTVIVEQKPGASGVIGADYVAKSPGDGYTLLVGTPASILVTPQTMPRRPFDPLKDFKAVNLMFRSPTVIAAGAKLGVKNMRAVAALTQTRQVTIGVNGIGGSQHVLVESINSAYGAKLVPVPYKSSGDSAVAVMGGHLDLCMSDLGGYLPFFKDSKLVPVAMTSSKRAEQMPEVPTLQEDVPGFVYENWFAIFAPGSTPSELVERLSATVAKVVARPDIQAQFRNMSAVPSAMGSAAEFQKFVAAEHQRIAQVIAEKHISFKE